MRLSFERAPSMDVIYLLLILLLALSLYALVAACRKLEDGSHER